MSLKQEMVAKNAYFFDTKKKYILYIINKEGNPVDEYEIKGLFLKRSEYPEITKIKIQAIVDMLLKGDTVSFSKIEAFNQETTKYILNLCRIGDKSVAKIVAYSKDIENYKLVPSHVLGMELWNQLEYKYFNSGTKGYQFKILGIDYDKAPEKIQKLKHIIGNLKDTHYTNINRQQIIDLQNKRDSDIICRECEIAVEKYPFPTYK
jgi:hypothetical protein